MIVSEQRKFDDVESIVAATVNRLLLYHLSKRHLLIEKLFSLQETLILKAMQLCVLLCGSI